jgi:hypothetical protein
VKKIILILIFITNLPVCYCGMKWIQKDGYLEMKDSTDNISTLKTSADGKYLYEITNTGKVKKLDFLTGDTIKTWQRPKLSFDFNPEDE